MNGKPLLTLSICALFFSAVNAQQTIGIIDIFGNRSLNATSVYEALPFKVGDTLNRKTFNKEREAEKLKQALHVTYATLDVVCCTEGNKEIIYVGISENGIIRPSFCKNPTKLIKLPGEMKADYDSLMIAIREAVLNGQSMEDYSQGHSLIAYPKARALQKKLVTYASQSSTLKEVLYNAYNAHERAIAVYILAYSKNKSVIIKDLLFAISDPEEEVRNNAIRALYVLAIYAQEHPEQNLKIPAQPFINLLNSPVWTDRNKASNALLVLTNDRNPAVLKKLHQQALLSLVEMAQWKDKGHAMPAFFILGRLAGLKDEKLLEAFNSNSFSDTLSAIIQKVRSN